MLAVYGRRGATDAAGFSPRLRHTAAARKACRMPNNGSVPSIHITAVPGEPTISVAEARAVAGKGLEGDRYFSGSGSWSSTPGTGRQVTLIELETIEGLEGDYKMKIDPRQARRNVV